jgi:hypothetical protein
MSFRTLLFTQGKLREKSCATLMKDSSVAALLRNDMRAAFEAANK